MALLLTQFGYPAIFFLLVGGITGLPVPDQLVLVVSGYLVLTKALLLLPTLLAAVLGSIAGITVSYLLGRSSGKYLSKFRFAGSRLETARKYSERFGNWALVFGYFVPGVRNLIGFTSGMVKLEMRRFAPYAYLGAIISSVTCVCVGYFLGAQAGWVLASASRFALIAAAVASLFLIRRAMRSGAPDNVKTTASATATSGILE